MFAALPATLAGSYPLTPAILVGFSYEGGGAELGKTPDASSPREDNPNLRLDMIYSPLQEKKCLLPYPQPLPGHTHSPQPFWWGSPTKGEGQSLGRPRCQLPRRRQS
jgi:hypothetical protein